MTRTALFEAIRPFARDRRFSIATVNAIDELADDLGLPRLETAPSMPLTVRSCGELVGHEAIVQEWYLDSENVGTWGIGITKASGVNVLQYKDNPQPLETCLEAFVGLVRRKYGLEVLEAFAGRVLTEAQFAAALSFHYNTGSIKSATWVKLWLAGKVAEARASFMTWKIPAAVLERRRKECDLFFDGEWSGDGTALVLPVNKPSYQPSFARAKRVDIRAALETALGVTA
jgi:lysozyme